MAQRSVNRSGRSGGVSRRQLLKGAVLGTAALGSGVWQLGQRGAAHAASAVPPAAVPVRGGQIINGFQQELQSFNPLTATFEQQRGIQMCLFDALWKLDPMGNFVPNLAAEMPTQANGGISRDGTSFTITLRRDVKWHDGQPFTAKDVVFTWRTILRPDIITSTTVGFDQLETIAAPDPYTVTFKLKQTFAPILTSLCEMFIIPEHILSKSADINKDEFNTKRPIGTGAFKLLERVPGDHITLEANRAYHGPGPYLDRLVFKFTPDDNVLYTQFSTGEIDIAGPGLAVNLVADAKKLPNVTVFSAPSYTYDAICPNMLLPVFQDKRVRQALYFGMDKKTIIDKIFEGLMLEAETYIPPYSWAYNPKVKGYHKHDPEKSKRLLEEAGWKVGSDGIRVKDGKRLTFENSCTTGAKQREQMQQYLQQGWREIGADMQISNKPASVLFGDFFRLSKFESIINGMPLSGGDPEFSFRIHSKYIPVKGGNGRNSIAYENPKADRLVEAGLREMNQEKRKQIYGELQEFLLDELPYLPIYHWVFYKAARTHVQGFRPTTLMMQDTWNANEWWVKKA